jgi:hypothetical protein
LAIIVTLDQLGTTWKVKLIDCISDQVVTTTNIASQSIEFTKSDGTKISKPATLEEDTENSGEFFIQYRNIPPEESILDLIGSWTYQGAGILIDGSNFRTSERTVFWVVS